MRLGQKTQISLIKISQLKKSREEIPFPGIKKHEFGFTKINDVNKKGFILLSFTKKQVEKLKK